MSVSNYATRWMRWASWVGKSKCLREAEALAESLGDQRRVGWVAGFMAVCCKNVHDYERAIEYGHRALAVAGALEDVSIQVFARIVLANTHEALGDYPKVIELLKGNVGDLQDPRLRERFDLTGPSSVVSRSHLARILGEVGAFAEGMSLGVEALGIAESTNHPYSLAQACAGNGCYTSSRGICHAQSPCSNGVALYAET